MYKVAVIENESELTRSGYANVSKKLRDLVSSSKYSIESFTSVNIDELFSKNDSKNIFSFDSLFISTNATSDISVLNCLRDNKLKLERFVELGKGIFVSSQKKISINDEAGTKYSGFLPEKYDISYVKRPNKEKDSGQGEISSYKELPESVILNYPNKIDIKKTNRTCERNEFRRHFYRSKLIPANNDIFTPALIDKSYEGEDRNLLMFTSSFTFNVRIVTSSIALDWEFHQDLLENILAFITEGIPKIAFIKKKESRDYDFDFVLSSSSISKIPHVVSESVESIPDILKKLINIYIYSPEISKEDISKFIIECSNADEFDFRRVYYFDQDLGNLILNHYANFNTIDMMTLNSTRWLISDYNHRMWGNSFWTTHDILILFLELNIDISSMSKSIFDDINNHCGDNSYDGVMGATAGVLELITALIKNNNESILNHDIIQKSHLIADWIWANLDEQNNEDKKYALRVLKEFSSSENRYSLPFIHAHSEDLKDKVEYFNSRHNFSQNSYSSEVFICKDLKNYFSFDNKSSDVAQNLLMSLIDMQSVDGSWTNVGRTSMIVITLLSHINQVREVTKNYEFTRIESCIFNAVSYIRSQYNWKEGNWNSDRQTTAKSLMALNLCNKVYSYSSQELLETIEHNSSIVHPVLLIEELTSKLIDTSKECIELEAKNKELSNSLSKIKSELRIEPFYRHLTFIFAFLLIGISITIYTENKDVFLKAFNSVNYLSTSLGLILGLFTGFLNSRYQAIKLRKRESKKGHIHE
ncbi:hypothetical protein ACEWA2_05720 [Vibrio parahaemolyticus]